jgi:hypothetical protein
MPALFLPIHGLVYLQDTARVGLTTAQTAPVDGFLSEHNRKQADMSTLIVGSSTRTVTGTMRAYRVAHKKEFSFSWDLVPADYQHTVDGQLVPTSNVIMGMGGYNMLKFFESYYDKAFYMYILNRNALKTSGVTQANINTDLANAVNADSGTGPPGTAEHGDRFLVQFTDFSYDIVKRNVKTSPSLDPTDLWNVSMSLEEI